MQLTKNDLNKIVENMFKNKNFRKVVTAPKFDQKIWNILQNTIETLLKDKDRINSKEEFDAFLEDVKDQINKAGNTYYVYEEDIYNHTQYVVQYGESIKQFLEIALRELVAKKHHIPLYVPAEGWSWGVPNPEIQKIIDKPSPQFTDDPSRSVKMKGVLEDAMKKVQEMHQKRGAPPPPPKPTTPKAKK